MVLNKWAVIQRTAPPLVPYPTEYLKSKRRRPPAFNPQYIIRGFIRNAHLDRLQFIENRGMFKEEMDIERSRFPKLSSSLVIQTDGSLNEREFEFSVPPLMLAFYDRMEAHKVRQQTLMKAGQSDKSFEWRDIAGEGKEASEPPPMPLCNALAFPFAVPTFTPVRRQRKDPLKSIEEAEG